MMKLKISERVEIGLCVAFGSAIIGLKYDFALGLAICLLTWSVCLSIKGRK